MQKLWFSIKEYFAKTDLFLLLIALVTSAYGLVLISSAMHASGNMRPLIVQGVAIGIGVIAYIVITLFDLEHLSFLWKTAGISPCPQGKLSPAGLTAQLTAPAPVLLPRAP